MTYVATYGKLDAAVLAIGLVLLVLSVWPAGAYLSVCQQRTLSVLGYLAQTIKLVSVFGVRLNPSVILLIDAIMSLPAAIAKLTEPRISSAVSALRELIRGAPYQTLSLISATAGGLGTYAVIVAGEVSSSHKTSSCFRVSLCRLGDSALDVRLAPHGGRQAPAGA